MTLDNLPEPNNEESSSDPTMSRADFVKRVIKGAVNSGTLLVASSVVVDSFLVPPGVAAASACTDCGGKGDGCTEASGGPDYIDHSGAPLTDTHCAFGTAKDGGLDVTECSGNSDAGLGTCKAS